MGANWAAVANKAVTRFAEEQARQEQAYRKALEDLVKKGRVAYQPKVDVDALRDQCHEKLDRMIAELESAC